MARRDEGGLRVDGTGRDEGKGCGVSRERGGGENEGLGRLNRCKMAQRVKRNTCIINSHLERAEGECVSVGDSWLTKRIGLNEWA